MLARRDFYVRYRRRMFGMLWAIGVPLIQAVVYSVVFSRIVRVRTELNYPTFIVSGVIPWVYFSGTLVASASAITGGANMASKVYFPRAHLPLSKVLANFYGFVPGAVLILLIAIYFRVSLGPEILLMIPATVLLVVLTASFALVVAALQVYFRDVNFIVGAAIQPLMYASAVIFPLTLVPEGFLRTLVEVNPVTGTLALFRAAVSAPLPSTLSLVSAAVWPIALVVIALLLYRRFERVFVDLL